jgi:hypothetical protein
METKNTTQKTNMGRPAKLTHEERRKHANLAMKTWREKKKNNNNNTIPNHIDEELIKSVNIQQQSINNVIFEETIPNNPTNNTIFEETTPNNPSSEIAEIEENESIPIVEYVKHITITGDYTQEISVEEVDGIVIVIHNDQEVRIRNNGQGFTVKHINNVGLRISFTTTILTILMTTPYTINTTNNTQLETSHPNKKQICEKTKEKYSGKINKLSCNNININPISTSIDVLCETIQTKFEITNGTLKGYLSAIKKYSLENNINAELMQDITNKIRHLNNKEEEIARTNELSEKEEKNFTDWGTVLKIHEKLKERKNELFDYYLMLSYYVLMPPRRVADYANLYYDNSQQVDESKVIPYGSIIGTIPDKTIPNDNKNYFVMKEGKGYFIFNNYKTVDVYGVQTLEVNPELCKVLNEYIITRQISPGSRVLSLCDSSYGVKLCNIFSCVLSKRLGVSGLRHIYIIHVRVCNLLACMSSQYTLSYLMAHSPETQNKYWKDMSNTIYKDEVKDDSFQQLIQIRGRPKIPTQ